MLAWWTNVIRTGPALVENSSTGLCVWARRTAAPKRIKIDETRMRPGYITRPNRSQEHTYLPAMVGFVRKHVAQHFHPNRPRPSPAVSAKLLDAAPTIAERFREHLRAASGALGQSRAGLPRRAVRAVELWCNLQVRSCKPDPLGADVVHMREDRRNGAGLVLAGRFGFPGGRVKMFDKHLVDAIVGGEDLDCGSAELSVNLVLTRGHGSLLLDP